MVRVPGTAQFHWKRRALDGKVAHNERHTRSQECSAVLLSSPVDLQQTMSGTSESAPEEAKGQVEDQWLDVQGKAENRLFANAGVDLVGAALRHNWAFGNVSSRA